MDPRYSDMSEHRVSVLRSALRRSGRLKHDDPATSRDPRVRAVVEALSAVDYAPAPSAHFRAELRAQLVAVAPRIITESAPTPQTSSAPGRKAAERAGEALSAYDRRRRFARPIVVTACVAAAMLLLLGGAVWQSRKALPGDALYGLKRTSENVQLKLASGGTDRGHEYLRLADTRVSEAQALLHRDSASAAGQGTLAGGLSAHTAQLIASNLASADSDVRHGSDLLTTQAVTSRSQSPISVLTTWAPGQLARLQDLAAALPDGPLRNRTRTSGTLTSAALTRAHSLASAIAAGCASTAKTDSLGPVPTCGTSVPTGTTPTTSTPGSKPTSTPGTRRTGGGTTGGSGGKVTSSHPAGTSAPTTPGPATPTGTSKIHLPTRLPTKPISVSSCGISISAGPVGIGVGHCPSHS